MSRDSAVRKGVLTVGFVAVAAAVLLAHGAPANGYEVSIYGGTPLGFWVGVAVALAAAVAVVVGGADRWSDYAGVGLGGSAVTSVVALPLVRSYHFYGFADPLTHLGWVRALSRAQLNPWEFIYPGTHLASVGFGLLGGVSLRRSMQLMVVVFALVFLVSIPVLAYQLTGDRRVGVTAAFCAFLLLPVNHAGFNLLYYPFSMTAFVAPVVLYLLFGHVRRTDGEDVGRLRSLFGSPEAALFLLVGAAVVVFHPQTASDLAVVFVAVAAAQFVARRAAWTGHGRPVYGLTGAFVAVFLLWSTRFGRLGDLLAIMGQSALAFVTGGEFGQSVSQRTTAAEQIDVGVGELFAKLFLLDVVFLALAAALVLALVTGRLYCTDRRRRRLQLYVAAGMAALVPYAGIHMLGALSGVNYTFRHVGFLVVLATVLGAVALRHGGGALAGRLPSGVAGTVTPVLALGVFVLAMLTMYSSPFVYLPSQHVSAQQMDGYRTTFQHDDGLEVVGVRDVPERYATAFPGTAADTSGDVSAPILRRNLTTHYGEDVLLAMTATAERRETVAYRQLRYSPASFDAVRSRQGASRVVDNGGFTLYHVNGSAG